MLRNRLKDGWVSFGDFIKLDLLSLYGHLLCAILDARSSSTQIEDRLFP